MTQRVTDFRIDTVDIYEAEFYRLPTEARKLIEIYGSGKPAPRPGVFRFEIPVYRWEEIQKLMLGR